ncbi:MAG TPA: hypothetical protein VF447_08915 [Terriglobales bacterium]
MKGSKRGRMSFMFFDHSGELRGESNGKRPNKKAAFRIVLDWKRLVSGAWAPTR